MCTELKQVAEILELVPGSLRKWYLMLNVGFSGASAWVRYLADSAYWCYLVSLTPIVALQFVVRDWPLPGLVKCALVTVVTMAVLLASYEWCVRYTFVGAILNGRKYRTREATVVARTA